MVFFHGWWLFIALSCIHTAQWWQTTHMVRHQTFWWLYLRIVWCTGQNILYVYTYSVILCISTYLWEGFCCCLLLFNLSPSLNLSHSLLSLYVLLTLAAHRKTTALWKLDLLDICSRSSGSVLLATVAPCCFEGLVVSSSHWKGFEWSSTVQIKLIDD